MATIFTDDFNSYNDGDLNGQGSWSGHAEFDIQATTKYEGAKGVQIVGTGDRKITRVGSSLANGKTTFYIRKTETGVNKGAGFRFKEGANYICYLCFTDDGNISYLNPGGSAWVSFYNSYQINVWYCVESEWRSSDKKWRFRATKDGDTPGSFTDWVSIYANFTTALDTVELWSYITTNYFDHIAENPISAAAAARSLGLIIG